MKIDRMLIDIPQLTRNACIVKEMVLVKLLEDKIITEDPAENYANNHSIIVIKDNWFRKWKKVFSDKTTDGYKYSFVKL